MHFSTKHYRVVDRIWIHSHHFFPTNPWKIQALIGQRYCSPSSIWIWTHCAYQPGGDLKSCFLMKKVCWKCLRWVARGIFKKLRNCVNQSSFWFLKNLDLCNIPSLLVPLKTSQLQSEELPACQAGSAILRIKHCNNNNNNKNKDDNNNNNIGRTPRLPSWVCNTED